jgi:dipeptidyl-peptidase 4
MSPNFFRSALVLFCLIAAVPVRAQNRALTADDYTRAEKFMGYNTAQLMLRAVSRVTWLSDEQIRYRITTEKGNEFLLVDAVRGTSESTSEEQPRIDTRAVLSPDGKRSAFIRNYNLWVRDAATGGETQLTKDGVPDFGYATDNAGWTKSDRPVLLWSPDSKKIATFQHDGRGVRDMYLLRTGVGRPDLEAWKYPLPGDTDIFKIQRVIVDVDAVRVTRLQMPPDAHRSSLCDHVSCAGTFADVQWGADATQLAFISTSRDHKKAQFRIADAASGNIRDVLQETVETYYEGGDDRPNWRYLAATNEVIWFSERENWGHLYLYDARTGDLKNRITSGDGNVTQIAQIDEKNRVVYFMGVGKEKGRDPYFTHLYRVGFDGKNQTLLTPEDANHVVTMSASGRFFVDSYSKPDAPPVAVLRDNQGKLIRTLEQADISRLAAIGWKPPIPIIVKARDGMTDLYGLLYRPTTFDAAKKYPFINHIYPGPQTRSVAARC